MANLKAAEKSKLKFKASTKGVFKRTERKGKTKDGQDATFVSYNLFIENGHETILVKIDAKQLADAATDKGHFKPQMIKDKNSGKENPGIWCEVASFEKGGS